MKAFLLLSVVFISGCAQHVTTPEHTASEKVVVQDKKTGAVKSSKTSKAICYDGHCPFALINGKKVRGKKDYILEHEGKVYHFGTDEARAHFKKDMEKNIRAADSYWTEVGSSQR